MKLRSTDFIGHVFAQDTPAGHLLVRKIWTRCCSVMRLWYPMSGVAIEREMPAEHRPAAASGEICAAESLKMGVQAIVRRHEGSLLLSLISDTDATDSTDSGSGPWAAVDDRWTRIVGVDADDLMGEARAYLTQIEDPVDSLATAARELAPLVPGTANGFDAQAGRKNLDEAGGGGNVFMCETGPAGAAASARRLLLLGRPVDAAELLSFAWGDGTGMPPLTRYLWRAATIRAEHRRFDASVTGPGSVTGNRGLRKDRRRVEGAARDIRTAVLPLVAPLDTPGDLVSADLHTADELIAAMDRRAVDLELRDAANARDAASETAASTDRHVVVICGSYGRVRDDMHGFLRALQLRPIEAVTSVVDGPVLSAQSVDLLRECFAQARAIVVVLAPEDVVVLREGVRDEKDADAARPAYQASPNVLFCLGVALTASPEKTIVVRIGRSRPVLADGASNIVRLDGKPPSLHRLARLLGSLGCATDETDSDWLRSERFADVLDLSEPA
ncbi:hypothetical protein Val02_52280 [Virgisporangium aliadipatigenens]|uniref:CD-NTase-associated protein 12/Pycsar effector protein TIR domain-containing protein n=1 Tax=Virgisporangium aliadipatigenens TaxID=741659 RepID=A0A8J4DTL3_9ACTN|nr:CATRA conflict system CASPASE/TPR repeat-associated protein [Virgisporangium aliadipatigenens]GIJ48342.1 hypothetical protein Val02_52280 [Virgisporangium aliadipatigenens]